MHTENKMLTRNVRTICPVQSLNSSELRAEVMPRLLLWQQENLWLFLEAELAISFFNGSNIEKDMVPEGRP